MNDLFSKLNQNVIFGLEKELQAFISLSMTAWFLLKALNESNDMPAKPIVFLYATFQTVKLDNQFLNFKYPGFTIPISMSISALLK